MKMEIIKTKKNVFALQMKKADFDELVDTVMGYSGNRKAIETELMHLIDGLADEHYQRGYQDGKKDAKEVMQKKIEEAANEIESLASIEF